MVVIHWPGAAHRDLEHRGQKIERHTSDATPKVSRMTAYLVDDHIELDSAVIHMVSPIAPSVLAGFDHSRQQGLTPPVLSDR